MKLKKKKNGGRGSKKHSNSFKGDTHTQAKLFLLLIGELDQCFFQNIILCKIYWNDHMTFAEKVWLSILTLNQ